MIRRRHLLYLLCTSSVRPPSSTPFFTAPPPLPPSLFPKGYSQESSKREHAEDEPITHEKAPTTLEEFKRLLDEKESQGVASQTIDKAEDGFMEAVTDDDSVDSVKESFKEPPGVGNFRRTGD